MAWEADSSNATTILSSGRKVPARSCVAVVSGVPLSATASPLNADSIVQHWEAENQRAHHFAQIPQFESPMEQGRRRVASWRGFVTVLPVMWALPNDRQDCGGNAYLIVSRRLAARPSSSSEAGPPPESRGSTKTPIFQEIVPVQRLHRISTNDLDT